jgi:hypothetical protein
MKYIFGLFFFQWKLDSHFSWNEKLGFLVSYLCNYVCSDPKSLSANLKNSNISVGIWKLF